MRLLRSHAEVRHVARPHPPVMRTVDAAPGGMPLGGEDSPPRRPGTRSPWVILSLVLLAQFSSPLVVFSLGALAPLLRDALHLSREQIGALAALFYTGAALSCIPAGWLADRLGVRILLIAAQAMSGFGLAAIPFLPISSALHPVIVLAGMAYGTTTVVTTKSVAEWFPRKRRATAMGAKLGALACSGIAAGGVVPILALWLGWQQTFAILGSLLVASACGSLLLYSNLTTKGSSAEAQPTFPSAPSLLLDLNFWQLAAVGFLFGSVQYTFTAYLTLFLQEQWGFPLVLAASLLAQAQAVSAPSRLLYGWVSDRWLHGERKPLMHGIGAGAMGALLLLLLVPPGTSFVLLILGILCFGISGLSWGGTYQTLAAELAGRQRAGLGSGMTVSLVYAGSAIITPVFGYLADVTESYTSSWAMLLLCVVLGSGMLRGVRVPPVAPEPPLVGQCGVAQTRCADWSPLGSR